MNVPSQYLSRVDDMLPPLMVVKKVRDSDAWKKAVMDSFEFIGMQQLHENTKYLDFYRMLENRMSYQELKEVIPNMETLEDLFEGAGLQSNLKHYDLLGGILRDVIGKYKEVEDKYHVTDVGEIGTSEFLRYKEREVAKALNDAIKNEIDVLAAKEGIGPDNRKFSSKEEQDAFLQKSEEFKQKNRNPGAESQARKGFKSLGIQWAEATLERDKILKDLPSKDTENLTDKSVSGRCFREHKVDLFGHHVNVWSAKNTFFSKEMEERNVDSMEYVGRVNVLTPAEAVKKHRLRLTTTQQEKIMGGNKHYKSQGAKGGPGFYEQPRNSYLQLKTVGFRGQEEYRESLDFQETFGVPMGETTMFNPDGSETRGASYLPDLRRNHVGRNYNLLAKIMREDIEPRRDLVLETEVYFIGYEKWGLISYESETGLLVSEEVSEDLHEDFIKEKGLKVIKDRGIHDMFKKPEPNSVQWIWRPISMQGVKLTSDNLEEPIIVYVEKCPFQITCENKFDSRLPVSGHVGQNFAERIYPYQTSYNLAMNQMVSLMEKEIGMIFLFDVTLIPSDIDGWGNTEEALVHLRDFAKDLGFIPTQTSGDSDKNSNHFNQFSSHNLSNAASIQGRVAWAEHFKKLAFEAAGFNPNQSMQSTKYETAEGIKMSNEGSFVHLETFYEEFEKFKQRDYEIHLAAEREVARGKTMVTFDYTMTDGSRVFLQNIDPHRSLRNIGLVPAKNSAKRKVFQNYQSFVMNNQSANADYITMANILSSNTITELLDLAKEAEFKRAEQEQLAHNRALELEDRRAQNMAAINKDNFEKQVAIKKMEVDGRIETAAVTAKGRAADKGADEASFREIDKTREIALKEKMISHKIETDQSKLEMQKENSKTATESAMAQLKLKLMDIQEKRARRETDERIARMNKN